MSPLSSLTNNYSYLGIYCAFVGVTVVSHAYAQLIYTFASLRASRSIHAKLVQSLLTSTFRWLDVTPTSRVITRCTQDIQASECVHISTAEPDR